MNFQTAIGVCFVKYFDFRGRASRSEYWFWGLFTFLLSVFADIADVIVYDTEGGLGPFWTIIVIGTLMPSISVGVRRLHDVGRSGWWMLLNFTIIGIFFPLLYWAMQPSAGYTYPDDSENKYGAVPPHVKNSD